jgi:N-acetylmuramate 1-kinase
LSDTRSLEQNSGTGLRMTTASDEGEKSLLDEYATLLGNAQGRPEIVRLEGDASTRAYFRARYPDGSTVVLMRYPDDSIDDLATFLDVHTFLSARALPVPHIHKVMHQRGLVVLEDLGDVLLETLAHQEGSQRITPAYGDAVDLLLKLRRATSGTRTGCVAFELAFDLEKLMQEMRFFVTHFVQGLCRADPSLATSETLERFFLHICSLLASEPRILAHRDYHSRNLMVVPGGLVMIDFQDARMGPAQYDLASLLRDSYVTLPEGLVDSLVDRYREGMGNAREASAERFRYVFDMMSLQRNIKALGTFGYQVCVRGSRRYASSIPRTGAYVASNMEKYEELRAFRSVVDHLICRPSRELGLHLHP